MADKKNITDTGGLEGLEKTRQNTRDFFRAIANLPTEATGLIKSFIQRSPRSGSIADPIVGAWNFYRDTFGKGEKEKKIDISIDDIHDDPRLFQYLNKLSADHNRYIDNLPEDQKRLVGVSKKRDEEYKNYIGSLLDKYNITEGNITTGLNSNIDDEEEKTLNTMQADLNDVNNLLKEEGISLYPYTSHDTDLDNPGPEHITFDSEFMTKVRGEPDIKFVGDRFYNEGFTDVVSFPYLGEYGVDEDGKFRMIRSSAVRPFDDPGYDALAKKHPILKGPQMWEDFIAPEYSADPELFRSPGFFAGMGASMAPLAWQAGKWGIPKAARLASKHPWMAGIMTALQAGKAEAPTVVPEGVEATPENINKYGKILMEDTRG